jgi:hypothetical protein
MYIDYFTDEVHKLMNRSSGKSSAMAEGALHASQSDASLDPSSASTTEVGIPSTKKRYSTLGKGYIHLCLLLLTHRLLL